MVLARMALTNYRGFASRQSIELRPITVVLGRNNAGKSALVRAPVILAGGIDSDSQEPVDIDRINEELLESFADLIHGGPVGEPRIGVDVAVQANGLARLVATIRHLPQQHREVVESLELFDAGTSRGRMVRVTGIPETDRFPVYDSDDFAIGLDIAVAALAPRARLTGNTARTDRGRAILCEALSYFARRGGGSLTAFIDLLADLPEDVASLDRSVDIASDMAQTLTAARINDPLFGAAGTPLDPGVLLTASSGHRARISVISLIGLSSEEQRQSFVSRLQMGLMTWIKAHPASDRPLSELLVMDEAQTIAPSGPTTAATKSTLALASQARKYGLGLVFATQAPRGIHNRIVGNAATQFYGLIKATAQIAAVRQLAQGRSSEPIDVSGLAPGVFYLSDENAAFRKISVPMSLSHHPPSALSAEEVLARARR